MVRKEYDAHIRPGYHNGTVGYHADGNIVDGGNEELTSERVIEGEVKFCQVLSLIYYIASLAKSCSLSLLKNFTV